MEKNIALAEIAEIDSEGCTLIFEGDEVPTKKKYKRNTSATFRVGQRVLCFRMAGTWIVAFPIS